MILDLNEKFLKNIMEAAVDNMIKNSLIIPALRQNVINILLSKHNHHHQKSINQSSPLGHAFKGLETHFLNFSYEQSKKVK